MSSEVAIRARNVSKHYLMFARPEDRLKQTIVPRLQRLAGRAPSRYYRDFAALSDVSFEIRRGETVGIVGRNGSGKSTLLQIVCGTLRPTSGSVEVNGRIAALLELGAGFNPEFTGRENVYLNAAILGLSRAEIDARFDEIAAFAGIGEFIEQPVKTYSSGMYVRLAFAAAINVDPDILVVDEALAVGDEAFQRKCFARIEQIQERGGTILFVSHGAQTIVQLCSRAMLFDGGELLLEGRPKMVVGQYQRLANASAEAAKQIREAMQRPMLETALASPQDCTIERYRREREHGSSIAVRSTPSWRRQDYWDESLKPESTLCMEQNGARIRGYGVSTLKGEPVNILQIGKRYVLEFYVDLLVETTDVSFGMQLRSKKGIIIAGANTWKSRSMRLKRAGPATTARVRFEFANLLLPGTYFATCGARGYINGEERQLHRVVDALALRVAPESELVATGHCDLGMVPMIELV